MKNKKTNLIYLCLAVLFIFVPLKTFSAEFPLPTHGCQNSALKECNWYPGQCPTGWKEIESPLGVSSFPAAPSPSDKIQEKFQCVSIVPFWTGSEFYISEYKKGRYYRPLKLCKAYYPKAEINSVKQISGEEYPGYCFYPVGEAASPIECDKHRERNLGGRIIFQCLKSESVVPYLFCCPPPSCSISASPNLITSGDSVTISWSSGNANKVASSNFGITGAENLSGQKTFSPTSKSTYKLTVQNSNGDQATCETTINVKEPPAPLPVISGPCQNLVPCGTSKNPEDCTLNHIFVMIKNIVNCLVSISVIICLLFIIAGGLLYIFSFGNPENLTKAKNTILWALGGLALVFLAWLIVNTVMLWMGVKGGFLMWG